MNDKAAVEEKSVDPAKISTGLSFIRKRRLFLWSVVAVYVPAIWITLRTTHSDRAAGTVFGIWVLLLLIAVIRAAFVICPRCGNTFHMHGFTPLYLRKCLHCGLHISADKKSKSKT